MRPSRFGDRVHKLAGVLLEEEDDFYRQLISHWNEPESLVLNGKEPKGVVWDKSVRDQVPNFVDRMRYLDLLTYLPDDILTKVDRASMAVSLEARVPLLDHRVVEFSWRLPMHLKVRGGQGKWLLRQVLDKYVPKEMVERPKMGFGVPIDKWLRGPLREWAEELLDENRIRQEGYLNPSLVREKWDEHQSGSRNWQYHLWDVLMFQAWHQRWMA
jgi:asparagine synthase (glutamine-hydrolysing)